MGYHVVTSSAGGIKHLQQKPVWIFLLLPVLLQAFVDMFKDRHVELIERAIKFIITHSSHTLSLRGESDNQSGIIKEP